MSHATKRPVRQAIKIRPPAPEAQPEPGREGVGRAIENPPAMGTSSSNAERIDPANTLAPAQRPRLFNFDAQGLRVVGSPEAPWFVATDVLRALGLGGDRVSEAVAALDADEKGSGIVATLGGPQVMLTVNESGLYCLIFRSRKPQARLFRKWVTAEVLPAIRKSGQYLVRPRQPAAIAGLFDPPPILAAGSDIEHLAKLITAALGDKSRRVLRWSEVHALIQQGNLFQWVLLRLEACGTPPPFWRERACFSRYLMRYWGYAVPIGTGTCRFVPHGNGRHRVYCFERVEGGVA